MLKRILALAAITVGVRAVLAKRDGSADFVEAASAKGVAEIQASRLALKSAESEEAKEFAQQMIDDHTALNTELAQLAAGEGFSVSENAGLLDKAKVQLLEALEPGEFDDAYVSYAVVSHQKVIELFREYAERGRNSRIRQYALDALPKLEHHLLMAKGLQAREVG